MLTTEAKAGFFFISFTRGLQHKETELQILTFLLQICTRLCLKTFLLS